MNRAEMRRLKKSKDKNKTVTYNLTKQQLDEAIDRGVAERIKTMKNQATTEAVNTTMVLALGLPIRVLIEEFYFENQQESIELFADKMVDLYTDWQDGKIDIGELKDEIYEKVGIRFEEE